MKALYNTRKYLAYQETMAGYNNFGLDKNGENYV